jgi:hypothetical protein
MTERLDWKWIGIGVVTMIVLNLAGALLLGLVLGPQLRGVSNVEEITLTSGQMWLALLINVLSFLIGGFIVGIKSTGRTIIEPGISALVAVLIVLVISRQLTAGNLIVGGLVPFAAGILGGWLGERRQSSAGSGGHGPTPNAGRF